ncbi:MAG: Ig-like domain-containing protein [Pirellulaceae bacterium]
MKPKKTLPLWRNRLSLPERLESRRLLTGDFDLDGSLTLVDIELLSAEVRRGLHDVTYDLNDDGLVDQEDRRVWVEEIAGTYFGDSNLDGQFNSSDLILVFQAGAFEDNFRFNSTWETGDWNGDRDFGTADLIVAFQAGSFEQGNRQRVGILEVSPAAGERRVNRNRETIVRFTDEVLPESVNTDSLYLVANGERIPGTVRVSPTRRFATFYYDAPLPSATEVRVVIDGTLIKDVNGGAIDADNDGIAGGIGTVDFRTLQTTLISDTSVSGTIYDSYHRNPDGSEIPLEGVILTLEDHPGIQAITDANGNFTLGMQDLDNDGVADGLPSPDFFVHIDGSQVRGRADNTQYATLGKPFHITAGVRDQKLPFDIFLPPMPASDIVVLKIAEPTVVTLVRKVKSKSKKSLRIIRR